MKTLIVDTSTNYLYISFIQDNKEIYLFLEEGNNDHSEKLVKMIEKGLKENEMQVKDFDKIIVGIGPGSYTGLRVGLTVCKIFSWTLNIPLYTVSSLDIIASGYLQEKGQYTITMKCKRDVLYVKEVNCDGNSFTILEDEKVVPEQELKEENNQKGNKMITKDNYLFNGVNITKMSLKEVLDIHSLTPNYMR